MYEDYYGLTERPFQLTPDPAFFFESVTHKKALSYLGYGLQQGEGFIVITGEVGAGKSTLVGHLRSRLDWGSVTIGEVVTSSLGEDDMIAMAAHSFGLDVEAGEKASALAAIETFLQDEARAGRKVLLVVDEAQNLTVGALEELRMLSNFHLGAQPLLQMLLLGQPEFRQLLSEWDELEQLRQRVIATHHLDAMQPEEIAPYVTRRLQHAGWDGSPALEPDIWPIIQAETRGIPRLVNRFMSRALMRSAMEERAVIDTQLATRIVDELNGRIAADLPQPDTRTSAPLRSDSDRKAALMDEQIDAIEKAFAQRDEVIADLREELASIAQTPSNRHSDEIEERLAMLERRLDDQERTLRQTLSMMINFFETSARRDAA